MNLHHRQIQAEPEFCILHCINNNNIFQIAYSSNSVLLWGGGGGGGKHCQVHLIEYFMKNYPHQYSTISYLIIA